MIAKLKQLFIKFLAVLNVGEGIIHLIGSAITFYGISQLDATTWMIFVSPVENLIWGLFSLATGLVLGKWGHSHHHFPTSITDNEGGHCCGGSESDSHEHTRTTE